MKIKAILLFVILAVIFGGCFSIKPPSPKIDYYTFEYGPPDIPHAVSLPYVLKIETLQVSPVYDDDRILFREEAFKRNEFVYNRWRAHPGDLVADYLARDFSSTSLFRAVVSSEAVPLYSHVLTGTIEEFYQRITDRDWTAVMSVNVILADPLTQDVNSNIIFQNRYSFHETFSNKTPAGFAEAMSRAMQKLSRAVITDVYDALVNSN